MNIQVKPFLIAWAFFFALSFAGTSPYPIHILILISAGFSIILNLFIVFLSFLSKRR